jgi:hypothetical protein
MFMMKYKSIIIATISSLAMLSACSDDDSFSTSSSKILTFSADTISIDTVFSNVPSSTKSFWVYNKSGDGLKCTNIRLERGNQTGFRVNVDGTYLGQTSGYQTNNVEIRNKDSIRVFVEVTTGYTYQDAPKKIADNLIFTLESGTQQKVNLNAWSWDATMLRNVKISKDSTISGSKPIVIYGGLKVDSAATLTLAAGTTIYFHADAAINVYGKLLSQGTALQNVVLRGDRLDNMFDYLPYDFVSGQWKGIHLYSSSYDNEITYTDIHSTENGVVADSSDLKKTKLKLESSTIHNCKGYGLQAINSNVILRNCQITNTLNDCVDIDGGKAEVNGCTLAQFYPFDAKRGAALRFSCIKTPLMSMNCINTLVTGYADDVMTGEQKDTTVTFAYAFDHCIIRTPKITTADSLHFTNVIYEDIKDTTSTGIKHFVKIDTDNLRYDFNLKSTSSAIGKANPTTAMPLDRNGQKRDDLPDVGAYEYIKQ